MHVITKTNMHDAYFNLYNTLTQLLASFLTTLLSYDLQLTKWGGVGEGGEGGAGGGGGGGGGEGERVSKAMNLKDSVTSMILNWKTKQNTGWVFNFKSCPIYQMSQFLSIQVLFVFTYIWKAVAVLLSKNTKTNKKQQNLKHNTLRLNQNRIIILCYSSLWQSNEWRRLTS